VVSSSGLSCGEKENGFIVCGSSLVVFKLLCIWFTSSIKSLKVLFGLICFLIGLYLLGFE